MAPARYGYRLVSGRNVIDLHKVSENKYLFEIYFRTHTIAAKLVIQEVLTISVLSRVYNG